MKALKKIFILLVALSMIFNMNLYASSAQNSDKEQSFERIEELTELRDETSKTYLLENGALQWVGYTEDIHYTDNNGTYKEIDSSIVDTSSKDGYKYTNKANSWHVYFADDLTQNKTIAIEKDKYKISFSPVGGTKSIKAEKSSSMNSSLSAYDENLSKDNRSVIYKNVYDDVDIVYTAKAGELKEDIILRNSDAPSTYQFLIKLDNLNIKEHNGITYFVDKNGNNIFELNNMYMLDANDNYSENVTYTIEKQNDKYLLKVNADIEFLKDKDTVYPVIIDPSICISDNTVADSFVSSKNPDTNYNSGSTMNCLRTGRDSYYYTRRSYLKFNIPSYIVASDFSSAFLNLSKKSVTDDAYPKLTAYMVTQPWSSSSITWNNKADVNWNDYYSGGSYIISQYGKNSWFRLNVTTMVRRWMGEGESPNYGFMVKDNTEDGTSQWTTFYSSDAPSPNKPELVIVYNQSESSSARLYEKVVTCDVNCAGYALATDSWENFNISTTGLYSCANEEELVAYTKSQVSTWLDLNMFSNHTQIANYNSYINSYAGEWRVVLRVGYEDRNNNGIIDKIGFADGDIYDFHWWYQTSSGQWAEKAAVEDSSLISGTSSSTNPENESWPIYWYSYYAAFYDSTPTYYAIKY